MYHRTFWLFELEFSTAMQMPTFLCFNPMTKTCSHVFNLRKTPFSASLCIKEPIAKDLGESDSEIITKQSVEVPCRSGGVRKERITHCANPSCQFMHFVEIVREPKVKNSQISVFKTSIELKQVLNQLKTWFKVYVFIFKSSNGGSIAFLGYPGIRMYLDTVARFHNKAINPNYIMQYHVSWHPISYYIRDPSQYPALRTIIAYCKIEIWVIFLIPYIHSTPFWYHITL
jgi:hypothetical protein